MTEEEKKAIEYWKYNVDLAKRLDEVIINGRIEPLEKILNLIQKQDTEINKLNDVIDRIIKHIKEQTYMDYEECEFEDKYNIECKASKKSCEDCIKEYFMKQE